MLRKIGSNVQGPGLLLIESIRCVMANTREEATDFLSFRQEYDFLHDGTE